MAARSRNPKYDWFKNPRMTDEQLKKLRENSADPRLRQSITRYMRARSEPYFGKGAKIEWSQKHNWALFRVEGAMGIENLHFALEDLAEKNAVGKEHALAYAQVRRHLRMAYHNLHAADFILRNISALVKEKNDNTGTRPRGKRRTPDED